MRFAPFIKVKGTLLMSWFKQFTGLFKQPIELLGSVLIPIAVASVGWFQFTIQETQGKHTILKEYIDGISSLNIDKDLTQDEQETKMRNDKIEDTLNKTLKAEPILIKEKLEVLQSIKNAKDLSDTAEDARTMAKGQTLTALRRLDGEFKGYLIRFLHESNLIKDKINVKDKNKFVLKSVIPLNGANINEVILKDAWLPEIQLQGAYLKKANFFNTNLTEADLTEADLTEADLTEADLTEADLTEANLQKANLTEADLKQANLRKVKNLTPEQVKVAKNWEKANYDPELRQKLGL
jgi:uncharacterized protein YjbI with pentapeptide repeats